jgi:hypothetical protein
MDDMKKAIGPGPPLTETFKDLSPEETRDFGKAKEGFAAEDTVEPNGHIARVIFRTVGRSFATNGLNNFTPND